MSERLTDRPTEPGVWFRDGEAWIVRGPGVLATFASRLSGEGYLSDVVHVADLPLGNWSPAVPASRVAELEGEVNELAELLQRSTELWPVEKPEQGPLPGWVKNIKERVRHALAQGTTP